MSEKKKFYVVITAGGSGRRVGSTLPKQFIEIGGKSILLRTIELFTNLNEEIELILVLPHSYIELWKKYYEEKQLRFRHIIVEGGITRFHSVKAAIEHLPDGVTVAVHDGVRPFVPKEMILKMLHYPFDERVGGVIPVCEVAESLRHKILDAGGNVLKNEPVNRSEYFLVQTPQVFDSTRLKKAYEKPFSPLFTDDASVMEGSGYHCDTIEGSRLNLKITTPEDLESAEGIISFLERKPLQI